MKLILKDFFGFAPSASREGGPSVDPKVREQAQGGPLKVEITSSHAGMVNHNKVMYSPIGMSNSAHTFTYPQQRPIQIHHDDHADPIGRVVSAYYKDFSSDNSEQVKDALRIFRDADKKESIVEAAKALEGLGVLGKDSWKGVGDLHLTSIITDSKAVEKILDGRYKGFSITQVPKEAFCSICGQDWVKDGRCDHPRGEVDKESGRMMYLIVGDSVYLEGSFVNNPADEFAESTSASFVQADGLNLSQDKDQTNHDLCQIKLKLMDSIQTSPEEENTNTGDSEESGSEELTIDDALKVLFEDEDNFSGEMAELLNEALEQEVEEDAKLSTKQRKKLPKSTFCGPSRSFPVPDCAHVTAARRLVNRYKGEGSKEKILACVNRKAKALGCDKKKSDSQENLPEESLMTIDFKTLSDEELVKEFTEAKKVMIDRKMEVPCKDCQSKVDQISSLEGEKNDLITTTTVLREEWKTIHSEYEAEAESHTQLLTELSDSLKKAAVVMLSLSDREHSEEEINKIIEEKTIDELKSIIDSTEVSESIKIVRSGISREPEGIVTQEDGEPEEEQSKEFSDSQIEKMKKIKTFYRDHGRAFAEKMLVDYIRAGYLPCDMALDKLLEAMAK